MRDGKAFTSLRIVEEVAPEGGVVLYLVPSLMLLAQTLKEWSRESRRRLAPIVVCSDTQIHEQDARSAEALGAPKKRGKKNAFDEDAATFDAAELARPATTKPEIVLQRWHEIEASAAKKAPGDRPTVVVFSTYQSLQTVSDAQKAGFPDFDLTICDEAHRTTGARLAKDDESSFVKVHDAEFIRSAKRLYMTATPRVYGDAAKITAKDKNAVLCSMDDLSLYGAEFYKLGFDDAVKKGLLADYRVLILSVTEEYAKKYLALCHTAEEVAENDGLRKEIDDEDVDVDDVAKMIGCWRGLAKISKFHETQEILKGDPEPMKRAVAFCRSIKKSKAFAKAFATVGNQLAEETDEERLGSAQSAGSKEEDAERQNADLGGAIRLETEHVDGTFVADERARLLSWLRGETPGACRVLSNVRCLSEGVDVPNLDAAIFFAPRNSEVDVIQAVGRVMRKAEGKRYGYIILPVVVSEDVEPEIALNDNERYKVIWQTLNALRSHDERFRIMINQLQVGETPKKILVDLPECGSGTGTQTETETETGDEKGTDSETGVKKPDASQLSLPGMNGETLRKGIYAQIVKRCGDRHYLDEWAKSVAKISASRIGQIEKRLENPTPEQQKAFDEFLGTLRRDVNENLDEKDAVDMLTQHMTTLPVFDALFDKNAFSRHNPVVRSLEKVVAAFNVALSPEDQELERQFQADVRSQIDGVRTSQGRQQVIHTLYEQFFTQALPKTAEKLGVVYTPPEVVDYILQSVAYVLKKEFHGRLLTGEGVHILDPFTGTGAFISRLLNSGLIRKEDLKRKFREELHANEIMLLAYYIAAVNIEDTFYGLLHENKTETDAASVDDYEAFPGIVLTDTFDMGREEGRALIPETGSNTARRKRQRNAPIEIIVGNPPYSVGQKSGNDNNQNEKYPELDKRVAETYAARTDATNKNSLYDSYIKAFRWASDRIGDRGIIGFVSNGAWIDNSAMEGFRKCLADEFSTVYVFNLRGNQRTSGELSRREGGKIFGSGSRAPIAITILVKNPAKKERKIFYRDIGDYLTREEKLAIIRRWESVEKTGWTEVTPNELGDWINQRNGDFSKLIQLGNKKRNKKGETFFISLYGAGLQSNRDSWVYNFSKSTLLSNMSRMVDFYNQQVSLFEKACSQTSEMIDCLDFVSKDPEQISWTSELYSDVQKGVVHSFSENIRQASYRPFCKELLYFDKNFIHRPGRYFDNLFPTSNTSNLMICVPSVGTRGFSTIITNEIPDLEIQRASQCFPLYYYEPASENLLDNTGETIIDGYVQKSAITDWVLSQCREKYGNDVAKEDIFFFVYGALHSPKYREEYANELKKELARLALPESRADFLTFVEIGRELADLHVNYETLKSTINDSKGKPHKLPEPYPLKKTIENPDGLDDAELYRVTTKMKLGTRKEKSEDGVVLKVFDGTLKYNEHIQFSGIPREAFEYVVNGRSPIEWLVERYYRKLDKASGIVDDPNLWSDDPCYIFNLIPRLVSVALRTNELVAQLP